jgi:hypothetical protein
VKDSIRVDDDGEEVAQWKCDDRRETLLSLIDPNRLLLTSQAADINSLYLMHQRILRTHRCRRQSYAAANVICNAFNCGVRLI